MQESACISHLFAVYLGVINKEYIMNLKKFDENLELLPSVGAILNTKNGDVYDINADNTIDFSDPSNVGEMWNDQFNCEEWFNALHTLDRSVVDRVLNNLK